MEKKRERFEKLVIFATAIALVVSFAAPTAYAADGEEPRMSGGPQMIKGATPAIETEPIHNPAGSQMLVAGLTIVPTCDGYIDAAEWSDAYMYDISDTTGQHDGVPDPLGTVYLWLKQDDIGVYFAIRNNVDQTLDDLDDVGLYFDDNHDGCFSSSATTEGNEWLTYYATGSVVQWRWAQDVDCGFPPNYVCYGDNFGGGYTWTPTCFGIGIGPTGVVDFEVMIPYGAVDEHLDLTMPPDSLGFFIYCSDGATGIFQGTWPSQWRADTWREPCYYGHLICETGEEWPNHKMHYPQLPDPEGWDIVATQGYEHTQPGVVLADDFMCTESGPITDVHFWGSWIYDMDVPILGFWLSIHDNMPGPPWSMPGEEMWTAYITDFDVTLEGQSPQGWYDPYDGFWEHPNHDMYYRYDITDIPVPFVQDSGEIYWLNVMADIGPPGYIGAPQPPLWGWKTSASPHFEDDAVWAVWTPPVYEWYPLTDPFTGMTLDLSFVITTEGAPPDTLPNHYKTWRIEPQTFDRTVFVQDQFMEDSLHLTAREFLSNPVKKVVESGTFDIIAPNDHLTWYRAFGMDNLIQVEYVNQFESTTVALDFVEYLLVPTQKLPHPPPSPTLDHYKAYHISDGMEFPVTYLELEDQFDSLYGSPEFIQWLMPIYFLTPAVKNMEQPQPFDSITHYVAYEIVPKQDFFPTVFTIDQFGGYDLQVLNSEMLLVPSTKRIPEPAGEDFGDCPDAPYPTQLASDGARHTIVPNVFLGATIDPEADGQQSPDALGDDNDGNDDEDGVVFTSLAVAGNPVTVKVTASVDGFLDGWVDFNFDGDWDEANEQVFVSEPLVAGVNFLTFNLPAATPTGITYSRFRFSTAGGLNYTGLAPDGEVEDYRVFIVDPIENPKMHWPQWPDLDNTGMDIALILEPIMVALGDDWMCTQTGPVTDIHFWASFKDDILPAGGPGSLEFELYIWSDFPGPPSTPLDILWMDFFYPGDYSVHQVADNNPEDWYDPNTGLWLNDNHLQAYQYDFFIEDLPFEQDSGTVYWLVIVELNVTQDYTFGWKTTEPDLRYRDDACWYGPMFIWQPMTYPVGHEYQQETLDLAFVVTGEEPVICGDVNNDGIVNVGDIVYLVSYLYRGGPAPVPMSCVGDVNNDDIVNVGDIVYLVSYLYRGGPAPDPNCCNPPWKQSQSNSTTHGEHRFK